MKKIKTTMAAIMAATMVIGGAMTALADTQETTNETYNEQYPLEGMLDQLGLNFAHCDNLNVDMLYWSMNYQQETVGMDAAPEVIWQKCKETNNLNYDSVTGDYTEMLAIAKLANQQIYLPYADEAKAEAIANNLREFFKSFPNWKTATDYEKACHIARWIEQAEYSTNTDPEVSASYKCLVEKTANCAGYDVTAGLLAGCINLEYMPGFTESANHEFPVFNINGVWLGYDAATMGNETVFRIYDVYEKEDYEVNKKAVELGIIDFNANTPGNIVKYFHDRGYVVPTTLRDKFDSSLLSTETNWKGTKDILKLK